MSTDVRKKKIASLQASIDQLSSKLLLCKNGREKAITQLVIDGLKNKLEALKASR